MDTDTKEHGLNMSMELNVKSMTNKNLIKVTFGQLRERKLFKKGEHVFMKIDEMKSMGGICTVNTIQMSGDDVGRGFFTAPFEKVLTEKRSICRIKHGNRENA